MVKKGKEALTKPIIEEPGVPGYIQRGWRPDEEGNLVDENGNVYDPADLRKIGKVPGPEFQKMREIVKKQQPPGVSGDVLDELTRINLRFKKKDGKTNPDKFKHEP